jgi:outer membrane protein assembly factor BamB
VVLSVASLDASTPRFFEAATQGEFLRGEVENLSIDVNGRLTLGPANETIYETAAPFLWTMLAASDGTLFVGTGNEGKVFRVEPDGQGGVFFDSAELEVHALALAADGGLYVATSPDGKIYKVDSEGAATTFFDPEERYIWSLAVDRAGSVYAGTGERGVIYKIAADGSGAPFYTPNATHVTALAVDRSGNLVAGTGTPGRVLRIDPEGRPFVLLDSPFQEIRVLRFDEQGALYVAAQSGRASGGQAPAQEDSGSEPAQQDRAPVASVSVSTEITSIAVVDASSGTTPSAPPADSRGVRGGVYRISPDGVWDQLWESRDDAPYDLVLDQNGALLIGTGGAGKIYRLDGDPPRPTLLVRATAQQVTAFHRDRQGRLYYATANPGKLFRLGSERAARGTYESEARDAQMVATWGALSWRGSAPGGSRIELFTRSGNTATPDETWSPWSAALTASEGSPIESPKTRYLQWRAVLTAGETGDPVLTSVTAAYLQRNLRPSVSSVTIHPPGIVFQKPYTTGEPDLAGFENQTTPERRLAVEASLQGSGNALGRRAYQQGLQTLQWRGDDDNGDELVYDILYRREGETTWTVLRRGITDTILVWDTATVPNGSYFVKVVASDAPANSSETALVGEMESAVFDIDNTPPAITVTGVRYDRGRAPLERARAIVGFEVADDHSPIQRVEFSTDGREWRSVFPTDGISDSRRERYEVVVEGAIPNRGLTLRAVDAMNNVQTGYVDPARNGQ